MTLAGAAVLPQAASASEPPAPQPSHPSAGSSAQRAPELRAAGPLQLTKTVSPDPLTVGDTGVYTLVVTNTGDQTAHDVTVSDPLEAHLALEGSAPEGCTVAGSAVTCGGSGTDLAPGASATYRIPVRVLADTTDGTNIVNDATATSSDAQRAQARTITIAQTLSNVVLEKSGPASVNPDGTYTYTFTVTNEGPSDAEEVTVEDNTDSLDLDIEDLPAECPASGTTITCPLHTLKPGETRTFDVTVHAHDDVPAGTAIENCADVYTGSRETQTADNHSCATTTVSPQRPDPTPTGSTPTPTDSPTPTPTDSDSAMPTPTPTDSPSPSATANPTPSGSSTPVTPHGEELASTGVRATGLLGVVAVLLAAAGTWLLRVGKSTRRRR
ncbi:COG1361 S-layer family protein [Streptomyces sp. BH106]|uniref:COG1361 S-layer family protein n=1 Tax=Streptomyces sp. BH106 TaxID=3410409 RepID=UPI003CF1695F